MVLPWPPPRKGVIGTRLNVVVEAAANKRITRINLNGVIVAAQEDGIRGMRLNVVAPAATQKSLIAGICVVCAPAEERFVTQGPVAIAAAEKCRGSNDAVAPAPAQKGVIGIGPYVVALPAGKEKIKKAKV